MAYFLGISKQKERAKFSFDRHLLLDSRFLHPNSFYHFDRSDFPDADGRAGEDEDYA